jgi:transcriptional regulator with XRE-family HTH domain
MKNMALDKIGESFRVALQIYLEKKGRGSQIRLAEKIGISKQHLSEMVSGKKDISLNSMDIISKGIILEPLELILIGALYRATGEWFPLISEVWGLPMNSRERAGAIYKAALLDHKLSEAILKMIEVGPEESLTVFPGVVPYLRKEISDSQLYQQALEYGGAL